MKISENFTLRECTKSDTAERLGIDNSPPVDVLKRMTLTAEAILEPVRRHFGKPVLIRSFYRCPDLNRAVGSSSTSQHVLGEAVDFEIPGVDNAVVAKWVSENTTYDQCILEHYVAGVPDSGWIHASFRSGGACRAQCLTINKLGTFKGFVV